MEELGNNNKWDTKMGKTGKGGGNLFLIAELILKIISIFLGSGLDLFGPPQKITTGSFMNLVNKIIKF